MKLELNRNEINRGIVYDCTNKTVKCENCNHHFQRLRPQVESVVVTKRFLKDAPDFDINTILNCEHVYFQKLHKYEGKIAGNHLFRALQNHVHAVYAFDEKNRLIFLRAFENFSNYKKFLDGKKAIKQMIEQS